MRFRILQHLFICIILLAFAESWWGSSSSSSRTTGSTGRTSVPTSRRTGSSGKSTGWFWGRSNTGTIRRNTESTRRTTGSTRRTTGSSRKSTGWFWRRRTTVTTRRTTSSTGKTTGSSRKSTGWFWRRRSPGSTRRTGFIKPIAQQTKVSTVANKYFKQKSTAWGTAATWNNVKQTQGKYKCNLFVGDVLREAKVKVPSYSQKYRSPILANEWANPKSKYILRTGMYERVPLKNMKEGDIVAFKRNGKSGHVGIVSKGGKFISAGRKEVFETSVDDFRTKPKNKIVDTVVWRIKKKP